MLKFKIIANSLLSSNNKKTDKRSISFSDFYNINKRYYSTGVGLHSSGFPYDYIRSNGSKAQWTQPTAIGFYLQYLVNENNEKEAERVMENLLKTQTNPNISWNGLIPWLKFNGDEVLAERTEIAFGDNSNLSKKVAMVAQKFTGKASILATQFLNNQKSGYQQMYDNSQGLFYGAVDRESDVFNKGYHINRLFNEFRSGVAFVVSYFSIDEKAWDNLIVNTPKKNYIDIEGDSVPIASTYDGSGFQYSWPLLSVPEGKLSADMENILFNALYAQLDTALKLGHFGGYSASSYGNSASINGYSGKIGVPELAETTDHISNKTFSIYSLLPFLVILEQEDKQTLMEWITTYASYSGIQGQYGYYDSIHAEKNDKIISDLIFAVDNGSMILPNSEGPQLLLDFLDKYGKVDQFKNLYSKIKLGIPKIKKKLPLPPKI